MNGIRRRLVRLLPTRPARVLTDEAGCRAAISYAVERRIPLRTRKNRGGTVLVVPSENADALAAYLSRCGSDAVILPSRTPHVLRRPGVWCGAVVFAVTVAFLSSVAWRIEITGNATLSETAIRENLAACGVREGVFLSNVNSDRIRVEMMNRCPAVAWLSVVCDGTVLRVQVVETTAVPQKSEPTGYSHIRAARDGMISRIETLRGQKMVSVGDTVRAGELLVSGIVEERDGDLGFYDASARVYAFTNRSASATVSLFDSEWLRDAPKIGEISISFFGITIKIPLRYGLDTASCDIIQRNQWLTLFGALKTPVSLSLVETVTARSVPLTLSPTEAESRARGLALSQITDAIDGSIVSRVVRVTRTDYAVTVTVDAVCEENIAQRTPFTAEP